jgi:hypothetical protein
MVMFFSRGIECHNRLFHRLQVWRTDTLTFDFDVMICSLGDILATRSMTSNVQPSPKLHGLTNKG